MATTTTDQQQQPMQALNYTNAAILAPMVRIGTLPVRLMALEYGADLVYTPEVVDKGIVGCERVVNADNGTIDYLSKGVSIFRTHPSEKSRLVFQIGSANAELALQAALTVAQDVSTIDLNCGCPKRFSIHGGMGAALMEEPEKLCGILKNLVDNCGLPVTCKIRIFPDRERTLKLVKMIEATGIKALAVHCRYRDERPREPGHWDRFKEIVDAVSIPVIANGDIREYADMARIRELSGCAGVMIARGAEANVSIFRKEGRLPLMDIVRQYMRKCLETRNHHSNTKYCVMQMFIEDTKSPYYKPLCEAKSFRAVCKVFDMEGELDAWIKKQEEHGWPTDLDSAPRKAAESKEKKEKANANVNSNLGKRKQDDLKEEAIVPATSATTATTAQVEVKQQMEEGAPALKKHAGEDGASSQPTPADTPQPEVDTEVETAPVTSTTLA
ncbi:tRNA-dihydrouridine(20) synthase [NAD(P)+]-like [Linnemannia exigua]|uniref:tRNA-dihydrouridine(20) synthase [NAD(P)+]-like n=1 Tax=Linnemannia exigua TaxID=604196 RepID=A0AAD4DG19_9FUNG|nr:tRNA-dihydrouridine(20) synthase [NAD(P)+]-like [Linnemannia exigua]